MKKIANILKAGLLATLLSIGFHCNAQYKKDPLELQMDSLTAALHRQGVDTICVYRSYCVGCRGGRIADDSPCVPKGFLIPTNVLWKWRGSTNMIYLDNCSQKAPVLVRNVRFWEYLAHHHAEIANGKIKQFSVIDKKENDGKPETILQNHGGRVSYRSFIGNDTIKQHFNTFSLLRKTEHDKNIYYKQNQSSPIWKLHLLIAEAILQASKDAIPIH